MLAMPLEDQLDEMHRLLSLAEASGSIEELKAAVVFLLREGIERLEADLTTLQIRREDNTLMAGEPQSKNPA